MREIGVTCRVLVKKSTYKKGWNHPRRNLIKHQGLGWNEILKIQGVQLKSGLILIWVIYLLIFTKCYCNECKM